MFEALELFKLVVADVSASRPPSAESVPLSSCASESSSPSESSDGGTVPSKSKKLSENMPWF